MLSGVSQKCSDLHFWISIQASKEFDLEEAF